MARAGDLIIASSVLTLINTITATGMFWLYGILLVLRFVPETKGRTLEEVDAELTRRATA